MDKESKHRRFKDFKCQGHEVSAWTGKRNLDRKKIKFGIERTKTDKKLSKYYVL